VEVNTCQLEWGKRTIQIYESYDILNLGLTVSASRWYMYLFSVIELLNWTIKG
jgi:hypothetical protein